MALLKQVKLALARECRGVVGNRTQFPALCFPEGARALDPIERKEAAVIPEPLAELGAGEPGAKCRE